MWQMEDDSGEYESSGTPLSWSQPQKPSACQEKPILESVSSEVLTSRQQQYYWNALSNSHPFFLRSSDHQARKGVTVMTCVLALTFRRSSDYCYKMGQGNICLTFKWSAWEFVGWLWWQMNKHSNLIQRRKPWWLSQEWGAVTPPGNSPIPGETLGWGESGINGR